MFATTFNFGGTFVSGSLLFAGLCALLAASKGRSAIAWGLTGFFFQCFGLLFVLLAGDLNVGTEDEKVSRQHRRRVNERMKRESTKLARIKNEMRGRLDAHDIASGIDTRAIHRPLTRGMIPQNKKSQPCWYYEEGGETAGPIASKSLMALLTSGVIHSRTLVWREGMSEWTSFSDVQGML